MSSLSVSRLTVRLRYRNVIDSVSFDVAPGEFIGLIGPNGAGKSSLLRALAGILPFDGSVRIGDHESTTLGAELRALEIAFLPQERDIAWNISVETLVGLGRSPHLPAFASMRPQDRRIVEAAMQRMDVTEFQQRPVMQLSGGERARVLIARALAQETPLLLADEPTAGLDPAHNLAVMSLFGTLAAEGRSIIASTHDLGLAASCCTRLLLLNAGKIVADGPPSEVLTASTLRAVYGVESYITSSEGHMIVQPISLSNTAREKQAG
jgi:iron complex transport system ATP-binding protein